MEPVQDDLPIPVASSVPRSSDGVPASPDTGDFEVVVRGAREPSTSKPPIECSPDFLELKNIWGMLWVPWDIIREECSVKDGHRLRRVEKHWRKCCHYGPNTPGTDVKADPSSNHRLVIPSKKERICTPASAGEGSYIMMLESLWHQLKIRFPFSDL
jgi:hypothetical protein